MITDEDVVQLFRHALATPVGFKDTEIAGRTRQISQGNTGRAMERRLPRRMRSSHDAV